MAEADVSSPPYPDPEPSIVMQVVSSNMLELPLGENLNEILTDAAPPRSISTSCTSEDSPQVDVKDGDVSRSSLNADTCAPANYSGCWTSAKTEVGESIATPFCAASCSKRLYSGAVESTSASDVSDSALGASCAAGPGRTACGSGVLTSCCLTCARVNFPWP